jgi:hypothetical protein
MFRSLELSTSLAVAAVRGVRLRPNAKIVMAPGLFRFFVLASGLVLFSELGPGLGHFDQQGLVSLVRGFVGQAQAFGRAPLMVLEFGHGTLPLRSNAEAGRSVPRNRKTECGQVARWRAVATVHNREECVSSCGVRYL